MRFVESNSSLDDMLFKPRGISLQGWKSLLVVLFSLLITITTVGNLLTLVAAVKMKQFHNSVSNLYIASLAGADLIIGSFIVTFRVLYLVGFNGVWIFGDWLCDTWQILDFACCSISLYSICAIAFDRWFNLQKPLRIFKRSRSFAKKSILVIWVMPLVISITAFSTIGGRTTNTDQCCFSWENISLVPVFVIPVFYIPVLLLLVFFLRIAYVIRNHFHFLQKHANSDKKCKRTTRRVGQEPTTALSPNHSPIVPASPISLGGARGMNNDPGVCFSPASTAVSRGCAGSSSPTLALSTPFSPNSQTQTAIGRSLQNGASECFQIHNGSAVIMNLGARTLNTTEVTSTATSTRAGCKISQPCLPTGYLKRDLDQLERQKIFRKEKSTSMRSSIDKNLHRPKSEVTLFSLGDFADNGTDADSDLTPNSMGRNRRLRKQTIRQQSLAGYPMFTSSDAASSAEHSPVFRKISAGRRSGTSTAPLRRQAPPLLRAKTETALMPGPGKKLSRLHSRLESEFLPYLPASVTRKFSSNLFSEIIPNATFGIGQQMRAARAVGIIMVCFLICWLPFITIWPIKITCPSCISDRMYDSAIWVNYLNSTINPILYALCSPRFQMCIRRYVAANKRRRNTSTVRGLSKL